VADVTASTGNAIAGSLRCQRTSIPTRQDWTRTEARVEGGPALDFALPACGAMRRTWLQRCRER